MITADFEGPPDYGTYRPLRPGTGRLVLVGAVAGALWVAWALEVEGDPGADRAPSADWFDPVAVELTAGETHRYAFHLPADEYMEIEVEQLGIDVVLAVFGPDGERLANFDSPTQNQGSELAFVVTQSAGTHHLEIATAYLEGERGHYRIRRRAPRRATCKDRHRGRFQKLWLKAYSLSQGDSTSSEWDRALSIYEEMIHLARLAGDRIHEAWAWHFMAGLYRILGKPTEALAANRAALALWQQEGRRGMEAFTYLGISTIYMDLGGTEKAFDYATRALAVGEESENPRWEGDASSWLSHLHALRGEYLQAIELQEEALRISRAEGLLDIEARALRQLGGFYESLGQCGQALDVYQQALLLSEASSRWRYQLKAARLFDMARCAASLGKHQESEGYFRRALESSRNRDNDGVQNGREASLLHFLPAEVDERLGRAEEALAKYRTALALYRKKDDPRNVPETLYRIARLEARRDRLKPALASIEEAVGLIDARRTVVHGDRFRALFLASQHEYYELWIDLLMRLDEARPGAGHDARALEVYERSRARSLREALSETRRGIRRGVDPALLDRERHLSDRLSGFLLEETRSSGRMTDVELTDLLSELGEVRARIRTHSPWDDEPTLASSLSLPEIRRRVLDDETLLLEYALGEERGFLWAVTTASIESFVLPGRAEIEGSARRFYELLTARGRHLRFETEEAYRRRVAEADAAYPAAAAELSEMLLAPLPRRLERPRILVVGEGILQYVPFSALPKPGRSTPLVVEHEVVSAPSASAIDAARRRPGPPGPRKTLAMVADPLFGSEEQSGWQRLLALFGRGETSPVGSGEPLWDLPLERSLRTVGLANLGRLPGARDEAEAILRLVPDGESLEALGLEASRGMVLSGALRRYRIVHFATHALLNSRHPDLSGIVLSLVDEKGRPQDGFLRLHDVYNLELQADLVVLAACQTALGQQIRGEGLVGLTRGFMYAGAPAVVASLWSPEDRATAELMERFYRGMLRDGLAPAAALRAAQLELLRDEPWRAPYYWAAFVLQGDWRARVDSGRR